MKKMMLTFGVLALISGISVAQDAKPAPRVAPEDHLLNLIDMCKRYAAEDDVAAKDLDAYILACVNDELAADDFQLIPSLPKKTQ